MRVVTWNLRRANATHRAWRYLAELDPNIALVQEFTAIPEFIQSSYAIRAARPFTRSGRPQRFECAVLVKGEIDDAVPLLSGIGWVDEELQRFAPNVLSYRVRVPAAPVLTVLGVYSPAWPIDRARLQGVDVERVKLTRNPDVWVSDLVVAALRPKQEELKDSWIVAGDFNACETFDSWRGGPRGNREWLDRMAAVGLVECLRESQGQLTPTFRKPGAATAGSQIDHLFVGRDLAAWATACRTGDADSVFGQGLSDHLPIVLDLKLDDDPVFARSGRP